MIPVRKVQIGGASGNKITTNIFQITCVLISEAFVFFHLQDSVKWHLTKLLQGRSGSHGYKSILLDHIFIQVCKAF
jgi:hypothetical protein